MMRVLITTCLLLTPALPAWALSQTVDDCPGGTRSGVCVDTHASDCSSRIGQATINEARRGIGGADAFIELRLLDPSIPVAEFESWTLSYCSGRTGNCHSVGLDDPDVDSSGYPWLVLTEAGLLDDRDISFGSPGDGMEIRLDDADGNAIDYLSVAGFSDDLQASCTFAYETTMESTNSAGIMRLPDGIGDWMDNGPGNSSGDPTPGDSNDDEPPFPGPDHIRLLHPGQGVTCAAQPVTIQACADADCDALFDDEVLVELQSPAGNWSANPVTVDGTASVTLQVTTPGEVTLDAGAIPPATGPTRCFANGQETCQMTWNEAGFLIDVPDHVAAMTQPIQISAVRSDDETLACTPAFADQTRDIELWSTYQNPATGSRTVNVNGTAIAPGSPGTPVALDFDAEGRASATLDYPDVGEVGIQVRFEGSGPEAGLLMTGQGRFIARPADFVIDIPGNPAAETFEQEVFRRAGAGFEMSVVARNAAGEATPNFGLETPAESVVVSVDAFVPLATTAALDGQFGDFGFDCEGNSAAGGSACGTFSWPEVGIIELTPALSDPPYLGTGPVSGLPSGPVGRFIPDHFVLGSRALNDRAALADCSASFSYIGERFDAEFTLLARNIDSEITANYEGDFARLEAGQLGLAGSEPGFEVIDAAIDWMVGAGSVSAALRLARNQPLGPFTEFEVTTSPIDEDGVERSGSGLIDSTELRFGRIVIDNGIGSESGPVALPWRVEVWRDETWQVSNDDQCTHLLPTEELVLSSAIADDTPGDEPIDIAPGGITALDEGLSELTASAGQGRLVFSAPGVPGWLDVRLELTERWSFLADDLDDSGDYEDMPMARGTFGLFDGTPNRIFLREVRP